MKASSINRYTEQKGVILFTATILDSNPNIPLMEAHDVEKQVHLFLVLITKIAVRFIARTCKSVLKVKTHEITFEDCVPGGTYVKDLAVWNCSEIPLEFTISYPILPLCLFSSQFDATARQLHQIRLRKDTKEQVNSISYPIVPL